jgi:hypothetical protein
MAVHTHGANALHYFSENNISPRRRRLKNKSRWRLQLQHRRDAVDANLIFEIADLAAQRRLCGVQSFLSRERQAALLGDRDEVTKVP